MEFLLGSFLLLLAFVAIGVLIGLSARRNRLERERWNFLLRRAHQLGYTITPNPVVDWAALVPGQNASGVSLAVSGVVDGWPVVVAQYRHITHSTTMVNGQVTPTTHAHDYVVHVVYVPLHMRQLSIAVHDRSGASRLGRMLFGDAPTALGHEEFDKRFKIWADPPHLAQRLIGPELVAEHLAGRLPTWNLYRGTLVSYHQGRLHDPSALGPMTAPLVRVAGLLAGA